MGVCGALSLALAGVCVCVCGEPDDYYDRDADASGDLASMLADALSAVVAGADAGSGDGGARTRPPGAPGREEHDALTAPGGPRCVGGLLQATWTLCAAAGSPLARAQSGFRPPNPAWHADCS